MNRRVIAIACLLLLVGGADALRAGTCPDVCGIPQTGQTTCRDDVGFFVGCADTGQDGDYQAGTSISPRFTDNGDGTVTDELTKLIWLQDADCFGERTWDSALSDANTLASGACGLTDGSVAGDWRLPNVREMHSLIDYDNVNPALPTGHPFVGYDTTLNEHWTSTTRIADPEAAFTVRVKLGGIKSVESKTATIFHVWPVRGGLDDCSGGGVCGLPKTGQIDCWDSAGTSIPCAGTGQDGEWQAGLDWPDPRFTDNGDGTVTDNFTDLVWLQQEDCDILPWLDGLTLANNLADGTCGLTDGSSAGDWRVPNVREMLSLADYSQTNPSIPAGHPFLAPAFLGWNNYSSTSQAGNFAWGVSLTHGATTNVQKTGNGYGFFAVRGGICVPVAQIPDVRLGKPSATDLEVSWNAFNGADSWDVFRGSLTDLLASGGGFVGATDDCVADDMTGTSYQQPVSEGGPENFFLVRAASCGENGTTDSGGPHQVGLRDFEVNFSGTCD